MNQIRGYKILTSLYSGTHTDILRAESHDGKRVLLKILRDVTLFPATESSYHRDFNIRKSLDLDSVLKVESIRDEGKELLIVMEDIGGQPLDLVLKSGGLSLTEKLSIAILASHCIKEIHAHNIIHSDIKPENFIYNSLTKQLKLSNFGIAITPPGSNSFDHTNTLDGTLAYMSPEKTGRIKKNVDFRSDFYSLGVTLYELFSQRLPFVCSDAMEMVHSHIARLPDAPHAINNDLPLPVSDIILKLMAKNPDDRYKSTVAILKDLRICENQYNRFGAIEPFDLGDRDVPENFYIPERLYGRDHELDILYKGFERVMQGSIEVLMVTGSAGIGKSALVKEISKRLITKQKIFLSGKFDQLTRNIAYSAIGNAFDGLVKEILSGSSQQLELWKTKICGALGSNGKIITSIIPRLETIIDVQPDLEVIGPEESRNRHNRVFRNFVQVFAGQNHPLVLFLDDLQWADTPSLALMELLLTDPDLSYLYVVGAYRKNKVDELHPLNQSIQRLGDEEIPVNFLHLNPLSKSHLARFIRDTVPSNDQNIDILTEILDTKARGNPFFVKKILRSLYAENLIRYSQEQEAWNWRKEELDGIDISDNVVEFLIGLMQKLSDEAKQVLQLGASIGNRFDFKTLTMISTLDTDVLRTNLIAAVYEEILFIEHSDYGENLETGFNVGMDTWFSFQHDRIQQAAYALIKVEERIPNHLRIGRMMWKYEEFRDGQERILLLANHLNKAIELIEDQEERIKLARLNLEAGILTRKSMAYQNSVQYLQHALSLLPPDAWQVFPDLTAGIYVEKAVSHYLDTNFDETRKIFEDIINHTDDLFHLARIYDLIIVLRTNVGNMNRAVSAGKTILTMFGIQFPEEEEALKQLVLEKIENTRNKIKSISVENLKVLPKMTDPRTIALMNLLVKCVPPSYQSQPHVCNLVIVTMVETSLEYGNSSHSAYGYDMFAILMGALFQDYRFSFELGKVAMYLNAAGNDISLRGAVYFVFSNFVSHWGAPLKESLTLFKKGFDASLEGGDHIHTGYCASRLLVYSLFQGLPLEKTLAESRPYLKFLLEKKDTTCSRMSMIAMQAIHQLQGTAAGKNTGDNLYITDSEFVEQFSENLFSLSHFYVIRMMVHYLHEQWESALEACEAAGKVIHGTIGSTVTVEFLFYTCLIHIQRLSDLSASERNAIRVELHSHLEQLKIWSEACPANYSHKYHLIKGELARLDGNMLGVMADFDIAMEEAAGHGFINMEALAYERTARFWFNNNKPLVARAYLDKALQLYANWGARIKINLLTGQFPDTAESTDTKEVSTSRNLPRYFDSISVVKASQAISNEINLFNLLKQFMKIIIEYAGAQRGYLLLPNKKELYIESELNTLTGEKSFLKSTPLKEYSHLPHSIIYYVFRTGRQFLCGKNSDMHDFLNDPFFAHHQPHSILTIPLQLIDRTMGVLYLENQHTIGTFSQDSINILNILLSQAVISIKNAKMFDEILNNERALKQSEERFRTMIEHAPEAIVIVNVKTGQFVEANEKATTLFGMCRYELLKAGPLDMSPEIQPDGSNSRDRIKKYIRKALQGRRETVIFEWMHCNATGENVLCEIRFAHLPDKDDTLLRCSVIDISERKKAEEEKHKLLEQLLQARKMKMIGQLTGGIAHDFNNLLTVIQGNLELVELRANDTGKVLTLASRAKEAAKRATLLIHRLLAYSRKQPLHPQTISIKSLLEGMDDLMERTLGETIKVKMNIDPDCWQCDIDPNQMENTILNLVVNARDAMPGGGTITIGLENQIFSTARFIHNTNVLPGHYVSITVTDTGTGIEPGVLERVFEPYFTTKEVGKGSGLGLSMLYGFIKQSGGYVFINSILGDGTSFNILLPRSYKEVNGLEEKDIPDHLPMGNGELILVVEDEKNVRDLTVQLLNSLHYSTIEAENGKIALLELKRHQHLSLIFTDIVLPEGINGLDLAQKAKEIIPNIKVVFTTGYSEKLIGENRDAVTTGMNNTSYDVLKKPFSKLKLARFIHHALTSG